MIVSVEWMMENHPLFAGKTETTAPPYVSFQHKHMEQWRKAQKEQVFLFQRFAVVLYPILSRLQDRREHKSALVILLTLRLCVFVDVFARDVTAPPTRALVWSLRAVDSRRELVLGGDLTVLSGSGLSLFVCRGVGLCVRWVISLNMFT